MTKGFRPDSFIKRTIILSKYLVSEQIYKLVELMCLLADHDTCNHTGRSPCPRPSLTGFKTPASRWWSTFVSVVFNKLDHYGCHHTPAALKLRGMHSVYFIFLFCIFVRRFTDSYHTGITRLMANYRHDSILSAVGYLFLSYHDTVGTGSRII